MNERKKIKIIISRAITHSYENKLSGLNKVTRIYIAKQTSMNLTCLPL